MDEETPTGDGSEGDPPAGETAGDRADVAGLSVEAAVEAVSDRHRTRGEMRRAIERVSEDGVVSREAAESALAHLSKVVATPETRAEVAADGVDDAREAAAPVDDLRTVRGRIEDFESRLDDVRRRADALGPRLQDLLRMAEDPDSLYDLGAAIAQLEAEANDVQRAADELLMATESFRRWVDSPQLRRDELDGQLADLETSLDELSSVLDDLAGRIGDADVTDEDDGGPDPALAWADATLQREVLALLVEDVRAELADLEAMADREDGDPPALDDLKRRLDELDARREDVAERVDDLARADWPDRFEADRSAFAETLAEFEPPVDWGAVEEALADRRRDLANGD